MSLAVGAWLRGISTEYMRIEIMSLDSVSTVVDDLIEPDAITAYIRNNGKDSIYLDEAYVDGERMDSVTEFVVPEGGLKLSAGVVTPVTIIPTAGLQGGTTYEVKIVSTRGTQLMFSVRTP